MFSVLNELVVDSDVIKCSCINTLQNNYISLNKADVGGGSA